MQYLCLPPPPAPRLLRFCSAPALPGRSRSIGASDKRRRSVQKRRRALRGDGERERERETKKDMAAVAARGLGARASARGTSASHAPLGVRGRPATRTAARKPAWEGQVRGLKTVASAGPVIQPTIQVGEDTVSTSRSGARHDLLSGWLRLTFLLAFPISLWRGSKTPHPTPKTRKIVGSADGHDDVPPSEPHPVRVRLPERRRESPPPPPPLQIESQLAMTDPFHTSLRPPPRSWALSWPWSRWTTPRRSSCT